MDIDSSTDVTKKVCLCSFVSIILIVLFIISPLSSFLNNIFICKDPHFSYFRIHNLLK